MANAFLQNADYNFFNPALPSTHTSLQKKEILKTSSDSFELITYHMTLCSIEYSNYSVISTPRCHIAYHIFTLIAVGFTTIQAQLYFYINQCRIFLQQNLHNLECLAVNDLSAPVLTTKHKIKIFMCMEHFTTQTAPVSMSYSALFLSTTTS